MKRERSWTQEDPFVLSNGSKEFFILTDECKLYLTSIQRWNKLDPRVEVNVETQGCVSVVRGETEVIRSNLMEDIQLFNTWAVHNLLIIMREEVKWKENHSFEKSYDLHLYLPVWTC